MKRVYISGKMGETELSVATREKFQRAEELLESMGHDVSNPADEEWQTHLKERHSIDCQDAYGHVDYYSYALLRDQMVLATCDAICLLPDWRRSPGARAELAFARATGKEVMELTSYGTIAEWKTEWKKIVMV